MTAKYILPMILAAFTMTSAAKASTIFNFDSDNLGTATTFTDTVNGLSATFSSSADPGGFVIYSSMFVSLMGNVLGDPGPAGIDGLALNINFSSELSAIDLSFATADFGTPSPVTLTAYENATLVGSNTSSGMLIGSSLFPEGEIAFDGAVFNNVVISSSAMDFAVDNIATAAVTTSSVPEPGPLGLVAAGIALLAIGSLRRTSTLGRACQR